FASLLNSLSIASEILTLQELELPVRIRIPIIRPRVLRRQLFAPQRFEFECQIRQQPLQFVANSLAVRRPILRIKNLPHDFFIRIVGHITPDDYIRLDFSSELASTFQLSVGGPT